MTQLSWIEIPPGSTIVGADGYPWEVRAVTVAEAVGRIKVTMFREGRGELTGTPKIDTMVQVIKLGPQQMADTVKLLKEALGAEVMACGWCSGDPGAECICDFNCGRKGCVNF